MITHLSTFIGLLILCNIVFFMGFCFGLNNNSKKHKKKNKGTPCTCSNPQWCDVSCDAKKLFAKDFNDGKV